ncbi:hypothetical protein AAHH88_00110 [Candidatus Hodgkinia cicadicola]
MATWLHHVKLLRKLTNVSISKCRQVLDECGGDFDKALELARSVWTSCSLASDFVGEFYLAHVYTRLGVHLFKVYANANIYNNRLAWNLKHFLNRMVSSLPYDTETVLNTKPTEGILVCVCLSLKFDQRIYNFYFHSKVCDFVCKKSALVMISSFTGPKPYLNWLASKLSKQVLFSAVVDGITSLVQLRLAQFIYNDKLKTVDVVNAFQNALSCVVNMEFVLLAR